MENRRALQSVYIIEFLIGFLLAGISLFVILTILFYTGFMQLYYEMLFPHNGLYVLNGFYYSVIVLSIGLSLIIDGYLRLKRIRMIQIDVKNHIPLESVSEVSSCMNCILIFFIVILISSFLFGIFYHWT